MERKHEVLFEQMNTYRRELLDMVAGVSDVEAEIIPIGMNNNIRWNLGHICLDQYLWIGTLTKEELLIPMKWNEWFGYVLSPDYTTQRVSES